MTDYAQGDYYDKNGRLLLAKGQLMTNSVKHKLESLEAFCLDESLNDESGGAIAPLDIEEIGRRINLRNYKLLEYPSQILSKILFECRTAPWWLFVGALSHYLSWLYPHSIDVALISMLMAAERKPSQSSLQELGLGALLHDVGKLLIPRTLIEKTDGLTEEEEAIVRRHCELGASVVRQYALPAGCHDILLQHHERLDGSGYPQGLSEDQICANAKIVMIADTFDAITSYQRSQQDAEIGTVLSQLVRNDAEFSQEYVSLLVQIFE